MTYKEMALVMAVVPIAGSFMLSLSWPYFVAYQLGKMTDEAPVTKVDPNAAILCGLGTLMPVIPIASAVSGTPIDKTYAETYHFFAKEKDKVSLPSANGMYACALFTKIPVLPILVAVSMLTLVPLTFLMMVLFEIVAFPCAAFVDYVCTETDVQPCLGPM